DAQVRIARPANALLAVLVESGRGHDVHPQLLARLVLGARRAPPAPAAHRGASAPSATYGMRSFRAAGASETNSVGGSQIRSRWQSAEIRLEGIAAPLTRG